MGWDGMGWDWGWGWGWGASASRCGDRRVPAACGRRVTTTCDRRVAAASTPRHRPRGRQVQRLPPHVAPEGVSWRGGAVLPTLDSARELWVLQKDWALRGAMAARETCAFSW